MEHGSIDTTEWEALATRPSMRARFGIFGLLVLAMAAIPFLDKTATMGLRIGFVISCGGGGLWLMYLAIRPGNRHPFVKLLATRAPEVTTIYLHELYTNGMYSATLVSLVTSDGKQQRMVVPRGEGPKWIGKLRALMPKAEYRNEVPPTKWI